MNKQVKRDALEVQTHAHLAVGARRNRLVNASGEKLCHVIIIYKATDSHSEGKAARARV
ncbi:hypothetical protein FG05_35274 [Fusarium graminearum]|nr:hypothetical protein FG05_35274 [Fusarium graminearum]